jgi:hypothetical protein
MDVIEEYLDSLREIYTVAVGGPRIRRLLDFRH